MGPIPKKYRILYSTLVLPISVQIQVRLLMEVGVITETGRNVRLFAEEELRLEPGLVQTQPLSLVGILALERELRVKLVIHILAEVTYKLDLMQIF